jgi:AcrR family transcriptional regulator
VLTHKEVEQMKTRETLMKAAAQLMLEVGYADMTTGAVAKRAGVAEGTIYRHFPSKEALAEAVFADIWRIFNEYMEAHLPPRERPIERLNALFPTTIEALGALMPQYGALCQQEHLHFASKHHYAPQQPGTQSLPPGPREFVAQIEQTIALAQVAGAVRKAVEASIAAHFLFFGVGLAMEFYGNPHETDASRDRIPNVVYDQLFDLMRHALFEDPS